MDPTVRRLLVELFRMYVDLHATLAAMGMAVAEKDEKFEARVGQLRAERLHSAAPVLQQLDQAGDAELIEILKRFTPSKVH